MNRKFRTSLICAATALTLGCNGPDASNLTHPPRKSSFPLFVTVPGSAAGTGKLYKIDAPPDLNGIAVPIVVLENLEFPSAVAVARDGGVFITERPTPTTGRIVKFVGENVPMLTIAENLQNPEGLAFDRSGKMYVAEMSGGRISLVNSDQTLTEVIAGLAGPRSLSTDENDNLYVTETFAGTVSRVIPDGTKKELANSLKNPVLSGPGLVGNLFYLTNGSGLGDGRAVKISEEGSAETYLNNLINPKSSAWEDATILYVAEGAPAFRILKYSRVTNIRTEVAALDGEPHSIAFTPVD
jgi:glucose/arabinose dehydrogenase